MHRSQHEANLTGLHANLRISAVAADKLRIGAGGACDLSALARLQLNIVHNRANRHIFQRHGVAGLNVDLVAGDDLVARFQPLRRNNVCLLAVKIFDKRNKGRAVRIVLKAFDLGFDIELAPFEIDLAIRLLRAAAAPAHGDASGVIATGLGFKALGERLDRFTVPKLALVHQDKLSPGRGRGFEFSKRHLPVVP